MDDLVDSRRAGRSAARRPCVAAVDEHHAAGERLAVGADDSTVSPSSKRRRRRRRRPAAGWCCRSTSARRAPSSTVTGRRCGGEGDPQLAGGSLRRWASKRVPTVRRRPLRRAPRARAALAITVRTPDHEAIRAPRACWPCRRSPDRCRRLGRIASIGSSSGTRAMSVGVGVGPRVGGVEPVEVGEQHEHGRRRRCGRRARRAGRCRRSGSRRWRWRRSR